MQNRNITRRQGGFTLIELLITVAIVAILAIMGATAYASFGAKAQVAEAFHLAEGIKHAHIMAYNENGRTRGDFTFADLDSTWQSSDFTGKYVDNVDYQAGQVVVTFKAAPAVDAPLSSKTIHFAAYETGSGAIVWRCGMGPTPTSGGPTPVALLPSGTAGGAPGGDTASLTNVPASLLPKNCRT